MKIKKAGSPLYKSTLIAICLSLLIYSVALAASGDLDTTFSGDGKIIQSFGGIGHRGQDVAVQADGKIVVVGEKHTSTGRDFAIARYNVNGSLDKTFSGDGRQVVSVGVLDQAFSVAIQKDGKIVVGGQACTADGAVCDVALVRLNANGALDKSFGVNGKVTTDVGSADNGGADLSLQGDKIVVAGYLDDGTSYKAAVYRYKADGSLDTTFSGDGILPIDFGGDNLFNAVTVYSGKIYAVGQGRSTQDFIVARINSNGTLDTTFSGDGKAAVNMGGEDWATELAISGGKAVVVGCTSGKMVIVRYTTSGTLDPSFSGDGKLKTNLGFGFACANGVTIQKGKIVVAGSNQHAFLARFTSAGALDTTFGSAGVVTTNWGMEDRYNAVVFKNSRLYAVGMSLNDSGVSRFVVAAYRP